jgi:galactonate dehydratase
VLSGEEVLDVVRKSGFTGNYFNEKGLKMKITKVTPILMHRWLFVEVETDEGIKGLGESGAWGFLESSATAVNELATAIMGQDPLQIHFLWNYMYRCFHFRGAAIMGALSAIDIALWDIAGKYYNQPIYMLLGGKCREKARVYYHVFGTSTESIIKGILDAKAKGYNAIGHLTPFVDAQVKDGKNVLGENKNRKAPFETYVKKIEDAIDRVRQYREAVGDSVDLLIELHRQLSIHEAIVLARGIEKYHPMFIEDPVRPDNFDDMVEVSKKIHIPIATGERYHTPQEFAMLLKKGAVQYVRPDVCICGGITGAWKIAAAAEAFGVEVVPHNPLSPVSTAACVQIAASIPNLAILEYPLWQADPIAHSILGPIIEAGPDGHLEFNTKPGLGIELLSGAKEKAPYTPRSRFPLQRYDGSIYDK